MVTMVLVEGGDGSSGGEDEVGWWELHYLLDKVVPAGTAPGPNSSDHNINNYTTGLCWWWRYDDDERLVAIVVTMVLVEGGDGSGGGEDEVGWCVKSKVCDWYWKKKDVTQGDWVEMDVESNYVKILTCKSSNDDEEDDDVEEDEDEEEEEEEHLALADSVPSPAYQVDRLLAISTLPPSPLTSYSSPLPQIPSPPLPVSSPLPISPPPLPASPTHPLGYRVAMIWLRAESPSTSHPLPLPSPIVLLHTRASMAMMRATAPSTYILAPRSETLPSGTLPLLPISLPTSSPPLFLPSTDRREDVLEVMPTRGFRAYYGFVATLDAEIRRDLDKEIGYGIIDTWDEMDTDEIYGRLDDAHDDRSLMSGQLNLLRRDRRAHARTARHMETKARLSCEVWVQSMDASDTTRSEAQLAEALTLLKTLETQMASLQSQQRPSRDLTHPDVPEEAGSSS
ncbi:hypothetical protein Tco_0771499 [Tanacetum coccineum]|uniref:Uncharacterized protein n=1 Tax=Tanacetum coccineum TaxID=301880 RepID=A0ABQ4ZIY6_9ASTR